MKLLSNLRERFIGRRENTLRIFALAGSLFLLPSLSLDAPIAHAEHSIYTQSPVVVSTSSPDTSAKAKAGSLPAATSTETASSSAEIGIAFGINGTTTATTTPPDVVGTSTSDESIAAGTSTLSTSPPASEPVFRGVGSKFETLLAPAKASVPPVVPVSAPVSAAVVPVAATTSSDGVFGTSSVYTDEADHQAEVVEQSAQDFDNTTKPITSTIRKIILKILSIFGW